MGHLRLLPGEKEELHFLPSPWGFAANYARAMLPALWGLTLAAIVATAWWQTNLPTNPWRFWTYLYGTPLASHFFAAAGLILGGLALSAARRTWRPTVVAACMAAAVSTAALFIPLPATQTLPPLLVIASLPLLVRWELCRSGIHHHVTNLRVVRRMTFPRKDQQQANWSEILDLDGRQGPLGRLTDTGNLILLTRHGKGRNVEHGELRLVGVRPFSRISRLMELLAQQATAGEAVRSHNDLPDRVGEAMAALHRK